MCVCDCNVARKQENNLFLILNYVLRSKPLACLQNDCARPNLRLYDFTADRGVCMAFMCRVYVSYTATYIYECGVFKYCVSHVFFCAIINNWNFNYKSIHERWLGACAQYTVPIFSHLLAFTFLLYRFGVTNTVICKLLENLKTIHFQKEYFVTSACFWKSSFTGEQIKFFQ